MTVSELPVPQAPDALRELEVLRSRRALARRDVEWRRLRAQQGGPRAGFEAAERELAQLTEALIAIYRKDLTLVDSLLDPTYPAHVEGRRSA